MKRIYKGNDLVFNLSVNNIPINMSLIKTIEFKFYTLNPANYIKKTEASVDKDNQIILEWQELEKLEQGVLYYDYKMSLFDDTMIDSTLDHVEKVMTDYYIVTGKDAMDISYESAKWGKIQGDINLQLDLVDYIKDNNYSKEQSDLIFATKNDLSNELATKQNTLVSGTNIKTINGESLLGHTDIEAATPKDIIITQNLIKQVAETKANKSYVDEVAMNKLDKSDAVGAKFGKAEEGELFNSNDNVAEGKNSHAEGGGDYPRNTIAIGNYSHAEGYNTAALGHDSHAEGRGTLAFGGNSHAEGWSEEGLPRTFNGEGLNSVTWQDIEAEWKKNTLFTTAVGDSSHAEGCNTIALGESSHAEGNHTITEGYGSHAEGADTTASGYYSHAEGYSTTAENENSHAEGCLTTASGKDTHAEGRDTTARGTWSHAEGKGAIVRNGASAGHAEGRDTTVDGKYAHAEGIGTIADNYAQHSQGFYNIKDYHPSTDCINDVKPSFVVGNGDSSTQWDSIRLLNNGKLYLQGIGNFTGGEEYTTFEAAITNGTIKSVQEVIIELQNKIK